VIILVALHLAAIAFYRLVRKRDLIGPMVRGDLLAAPDTPASQDDAVRRLVALIVALVCVASAVWVSSLGMV
jgi:hypothetical protein